MPVACPPVLELVPLLGAPPVYLLLSTLTDPLDRVWIWRQIVHHRAPVGDELIDAIADALVFTWCGIERWFAARLWAEVIPRWPAFEGPLTGRGVDITAVDPARATRLVWSVLQSWHSGDKDHGDGWRHKMETPPPVVLRARPAAAAAAAQDDGKSFMANFNRLQGGRAR